MTEWRTMDSAPKDGTHILAWVSWLTQPKTLFWSAYADEWICPASERGPLHEGWAAVTHWQPLPEPPAPPETA